MRKKNPNILFWETTIIPQILMLLTIPETCNFSSQLQETVQLLGYSKTELLLTVELTATGQQSKSATENDNFS